MNTALKIVALLLVVAGIVALATGGAFTWSESHDLGPVTWQESETYHVPTWAGIGLLLLGAGLFVIAFWPNHRRRDTHTHEPPTHGGRSAHV